MASSQHDVLKEMLQSLMTEPATLMLIKGVWEGDEELVKSALDCGARPDVTVLNTGGLSWCLLCSAASEGKDHLLPHLLQAGLNVEGGGTIDQTPLMLAAESGHTLTVKTLLSCGANPVATDKRGWTALHFAAGRGWQECVAALLPVTPITAAHLEKRTPVHIASYYGQVQVLEQLVQADWSLTARDSVGNTSLHWAAKGVHLPAVQWLVLQGVDPRLKDKAGCTPLELAVLHGRHEVETWLAKNGGGGVILGRETKHVAVKTVRQWRDVHEEHHNAVLSMLVEGNMASTVTIPEFWDGHAVSRDGLTPLHAAGLRGAPSDVVEALLKRGVNPHVFTPDNLTPADLALHEGHHPVLQALDTHQCQKSDESPEHLHQELLSTITHGDLMQAVSRLLCKGAPIDPLGGKSVLRLAVFNDRPHTVSLLLASGATLPANLLREAWQSPDVTYRVLAYLTTAYCCRLRAEKRHLAKIGSAFLKGIDNLVKTIEGDTPWEVQWRWDKKDTDRPALSDLLTKASAANCPVTAAFLHSAGAWAFFSPASGGSALHSALEAGHQSMAKLLIKDLGASPYLPDAQNRLPLHMMTKEEQQTLEQKLFEIEREKLKNMELFLKADHEKEAARTALCIQKILLKDDTNFNVKLTSSDVRNTMLLASRKGLLQLIHLILQKGCLLVDEVLDDICGTTAIHQAASHGQDGCVQMLLSAGASLQQRDTYGQTPAHLAAMFGHKSNNELLRHRETQTITCRAGTTAMQVKDNFKILLSKYCKYNRKLHIPSDHHDSKTITRNFVKAIKFPELQEMAEQVAVDLSQGEALEVKEAVLSEIGIIMSKVSAANPTYRGELRLAGSSRDGSKLYAPDEFDVNLVIYEDDIEVDVRKRRKEEAPLKGLLQISVKSDKLHLQGNRFMAGLYEEINRCLACHMLEDKRLSVVPPGLTSTQVGVALALAWQGQEYPLLLIGVDLVPVLEVPWVKQVSRPFLTPKDTTTMQLSNAVDGTWRCSFALTEAEVLETLSPEERQVQLMGKTLLSRLKAEPWMPQHKKRFFKWFATREWNIAVPSGFCFKNALLRWLEQRRRKEVAGGRDGNHAQELGAGQEGDHSQELGTGKEGDHSQEMGTGKEGDHSQQLGAAQDGNHFHELEVGQVKDYSQLLGAGQEGDYSQQLGAGQEEDYSQQLGTAQEVDHSQDLGAGQEKDYSQQLGTGQEGDHSLQLGAAQEKDHSQQLGAAQEGDYSQLLGAAQEGGHFQDLGAAQEGDYSQQLGGAQEGDYSQQLGAAQEGDHNQELGAGQEGDYSQQLEAAQEGDHNPQLEAAQEGDHSQQLGAGQEGDHSQQLEAAQEGDHSQQLGAGQEGDHSQQLEAAQEGDHNQQLGAGQEGDHSQQLGAGEEEHDAQESGAGQEKDLSQQFVVEREGDPFRWLVQVFRLMCANPEESREHLATQNSSAYFGGDCEGRKSGEGAPVIVQCLEEKLEKLSSSSARAKKARPWRGKAKVTKPLRGKAKIARPWRGKVTITKPRRGKF